uniref:Putative secreted protein n=1 Tax=Anopheles darlingi TaxID=43151 RepID=A0A2M4D7A6_ANODA
MVLLLFIGTDFFLLLVLFGITDFSTGTSSFATCLLEVKLNLLTLGTIGTSHRDGQMTLLVDFARRRERHRNRYLQSILGRNVGRTVGRRHEFTFLRLLDHDVTVGVQLRWVYQLLLAICTLHQNHLIVALATDHLDFTFTQSLATLHHDTDALQQLLYLLAIRTLHQYLVTLAIR